MYINIRATILTWFAAVWLSGYGFNTQATPAAAANAQDVLELQWEDLTPKDYDPYKVMEKYDVDSLLDGSPEAAKLLEEIQASWSTAPIVEELDGKTVKLPGFVVPLQHDGEKVSEFLLVPYYGACIHVPPPPSNQTVYVMLEEGRATKQALFDTVWVTGKLNAKWTGSEFGDAGYTLQAFAVTPYEEK